MADDPTSAVTRSIVQPSLATLGCVLRVLDGGDAGRTFELANGTATIGTKKDCDLTLSDPTISGRHLTIEVTAAGLLATDLDSKNGTFYLGTRLEKAILQLGAVLTLGETRVTLASRRPTAGPGYSDRASYGTIIGSAPAMHRLYAALEQLEPLDYTAMIQGETGVGKELIAREIHGHSLRANGPFEVCDCASLSPSLVESELFGHAKGAFTGADANYRGVFERANGGTIFLDEIGELPSDLQPKLLRVLESRTIRRVGSGTVVDVDVRVVAATNRDLADEVKAGRFRQDLFFRLNLVDLHIPPLRERREDIPLLIEHFLADSGQQDVSLSPSTLELFTTGYDWPGNVRELKNAVARALALGSLPDALQVGDPAQASPDLSFDSDGPFQEEKKRIVNAFERDYLAAKLAQCDDNISQAARASGMERNQFKRLLRKHGLLD